jgi:hypothetical protein
LILDIFAVEPPELWCVKFPDPIAGQEATLVVGRPSVDQAQVEILGPPFPFVTHRKQQGGRDAELTDPAKIRRGAIPEKTFQPAYREKDKAVQDIELGMAWRALVVRTPACSRRRAFMIKSFG